MSICMQQCARHLRITKALYSLLTWMCLRSQERLPPFRFVVNETSSDRPTPTAPPEAFQYLWGWAAALVNLRWLTVVSLALLKHYDSIAASSCEFTAKWNGNMWLQTERTWDPRTGTPSSLHAVQSQRKRWTQLDFRIMVSAEFRVRFWV